MADTEVPGKFPVKLLFFAKSREFAGVKEDTIKVPLHLSHEELITAITDKFPRLLPIRDTLVLAVNQEYVSDEGQLTLCEGDEVAVIPPLSGG
ncbi:uncharacterized protein [Diadema antillarum]|uniref:uncharacterized protein n=1 Tax=Diadema antillarum TaxID=105358 RepID=UPI003A87260C